MSEPEPVETRAVTLPSRVWALIAERARASGLPADQLMAGFITAGAFNAIARRDDDGRNATDSEVARMIYGVPTWTR